MDKSLVVALLAAYLLGSLPFAYWIAYAAHGVDPRMVGDGNLGAKNVFLQVGHFEGLIVGLLDIGKGMTAMLLGTRFRLDMGELFAVGLAVILGHNWPMFFHFQGGQGMATTIGVLLALLPRETLLGILALAITLCLTRHWNLACGIGLTSIPLIALKWENNLALTVYATALLPLIGVRKWMQTAAAHWRRPQDARTQPMENGCVHENGPKP